MNVQRNPSAPSPWVFLAHFGSWYSCVGASRVRLGRLPSSYSTTFIPLLLLGFPLQSTPLSSLTLLVLPSQIHLTLREGPWQPEARVLETGDSIENFSFIIPFFLLFNVLFLHVIPPYVVYCAVRVNHERDQPTQAGKRPVEWVHSEARHGHRRRFRSPINFADRY